MPAAKLQCTKILKKLLSLCVRIQIQHPITDFILNNNINNKSALDQAEIHPSQNNNNDNDKSINK